jgi:hypothetical protein
LWQKRRPVRFPAHGWSQQRKVSYARQSELVVRAKGGGIEGGGARLGMGEGLQPLEKQRIKQWTEQGTDESGHVEIGRAQINASLCWRENAAEGMPFQVIQGIGKLERHVRILILPADPGAKVPLFHGFPVRAGQEVTRRCRPPGITDRILVRAGLVAPDEGLAHGKQAGIRPADPFGRPGNLSGGVPAHPLQVGHAVIRVVGDLPVEGARQLAGIEGVQLLLQGLGPLDQHRPVGRQPALLPPLRAVSGDEGIDLLTPPGCRTLPVPGPGSQGPQRRSRPGPGLLVKRDPGVGRQFADAHDLPPGAGM